MGDRLEFGLTLTPDPGTPDHGTPSTVLVRCHAASRARDLAAALELPEPLRIDGREVDPQARLGDLPLAHGSQVGAASTPMARGRQLAIAAGPRTERSTLDVGPGRWLIGAGPTADLAVTSPCAGALVDASGDSSDDGLRLSGAGAEPPALRPPPADTGTAVRWNPLDALLIGSQVVEFRPASCPSTPPDRDRRPFERSPQPVAELPAPPGEAPAAPTPEQPPQPPGWPLLVLPAVVGLGLALLVSPLFGVFAAMGPMMAGASWLDGRRRVHRRNRQRMAEFHREQDAWEVGLIRQSRDRQHSRRARHPLPGECVRRAITHDPTLWAIRDDAEDALVVDLGLVVAARPAGGAAAATVDLERVGWLGVAGPPAAAVETTWAILMQLVTARGPADLRLELDEPVSHPDLSWLPHRFSGGRPLWIGAPEAAVGRAGPAIVLAPTIADLPARCGATIELGADRAILADSTVPRRVEFLAWRAHHTDVSRLGRGLARLTDPEDQGAASASSPPLDQLLAAEGATDGRALATPVGLGPGGRVRIDLVADGPHMLLAGTTGSGKSELLRSLVAGLAFRHPPTRVTFALIDFKGGSALAPLTRLPHVLDLVTDLDAPTAGRVLTGLEAELRHREAVLSEHGVADVAALAAEHAIARLVIVVDEFATLAAEMPDVLGAIVDLARRGRSLGLHLVLATQRPAGAVSSEIRANTNLRIALRTVDPLDSTDVIGVPHAASLPVDAPGSALLRRGGDPVARFRVAAAIGSRPTRDRRVEVVHQSARGQGVAPEGTLDDLLDRVVTLHGGQPEPEPPWLPPPSTDLSAAAVAGLGPAGTVIGLIDNEGERRHDPLIWIGADGPLLLVGHTRALVPATVTTLISQWRRRHGGPVCLTDPSHALGSPDDVTVVGDWTGLIEALDAADSGTERETLFVVHRWHVLTDGSGGSSDLAALAQRDRLIAAANADGRVHLLVTADRPAGLPGALRSSALVVALGLTDPGDYAVLGLRPVTGAQPPGRGRLLDDRPVQLITRDR